jgi:hypothetical protein
MNWSGWRVLCVMRAKICPRRSRSSRYTVSESTACPFDEAVNFPVAVWPNSFEIRNLKFETGFRTVSSIGRAGDS